MLTRVRRYELEAWRGLAALGQLQENPEELSVFVEEGIDAMYQLLLCRGGDLSLESLERLQKRGLLPENFEEVIQEQQKLDEAQKVLEGLSSRAPLPTLGE